MAGIDEQEAPPASTGETPALADDAPFGEAELNEVAAEIRAVAVSRVDIRVDSEELPPVPTASARPPTATDKGDEALTVDELRDAWPLLDLDERSDGLRILPRADAEDFYISLAAADHAALLQFWPAGHRRQWLRLLEPDDVADVIQETDAHARPALLALLDEPTRKEVQALLAYAEDEAGGLMSTRYARLRPSMTVDEAISYLRRQARDKVETIYYAYVLDSEQRLLGVVSFRDLFSAPPARVVADIMETDVVRVLDGTDQEALSRIFAEQDLTVIPVVNETGVMKGIVTVDDIVDVVQEEATEDIQKFGGMEALDSPYWATSHWEMLKKRGVWLTLLMFGAMVTTSTMGAFQNQLNKSTVLALFIPLIISSGGNSGSQASTLVIRAMALGELRPADVWRVVRRECMVGLTLGLALGLLAGVAVFAAGTLGRLGVAYLAVAATVGISVVGVVLVGTLAGSLLPFVLRRLGADPASASAPFVATLVDLLGVLIYFSTALVLLAHVLR